MSVLEVFEHNAARIQKVVLDMIRPLPGRPRRARRRRHAAVHPRRRPRRQPPRTSGSSRRGSEAAAAHADRALPSASLDDPASTPSWWLECAPSGSIAAGYAGVWAWDHFDGSGRPDGARVEAWTILAAAAARTRQCTVGTFVSDVMNRQPAVLARMAARSRPSAAAALAGSRDRRPPREHEAYGIPFPPAPERAARLEEAIAVIRALWTGGPVSYGGAFYRLAEAYRCPMPGATTAHPGRGPDAARVRGSRRPGDGWAAEPPSFEEPTPAYQASLEAAGRARGDQLVVVGLGAGRTGRPSVAGTAWIDDPRGTFATWRARGADEVALTARTDADIAELETAARRW